MMLERSERALRLNAGFVWQDASEDAIRRKKKKFFYICLKLFECEKLYANKNIIAKNR